MWTINPISYNPAVVQALPDIFTPIAWRNTFVTIQTDTVACVWQS
jgi:hypothetical protein